MRRAIGAGFAAHRALAGGDIKAAARLAGADAPDTAGLDAHGLARIAIVLPSERLASAVAIAFWFLLAGLAGAAAVCAVEAVATRIGGPAPRRAAFGIIARRLDAALRLVPALLAAVLVVLAALFVPGARAAGALRVRARDLDSPAALIAAVVAGALGLALGGP
ncbi:MAG: cobalamin biosynthesis protein, partial [Alphaproteobacteria bacterium]|nr:cobalamin biosynthesis protein [Alphaproteobacteria bacterium]